MNRLARVGALLTLVFILMAILHVVYKKKVQPNEAVWLDTVEVEWTAPVSVSWEGEWGAHIESFQAAIHAINRSVGCNLLKASVAGSILIQSVNGQPCGGNHIYTIEPHMAAGAYLCPDETASIQIAYPSTVADSFLITQHELLHVLGLAHDKDFPSSMMHPQMPQEGIRYIITEKDAGALRKRYCQ